MLFLRIRGGEKFYFNNRQIKVKLKTANPKIARRFLIYGKRRKL